MGFIKDDSLSRNKIVTELDRSFFVEASAGSGKTTSLVRRMVALVEAGKPVEQICTITFTKAAANEFFERFQDLLSKRSNKETEEDLKKPRFAGDLPLTTETSRKRCEEALANIDYCFMGTMDAFCNTVAHELPNELDLTNDAKVISNDDKEQILEALYNVYLETNDPRYHEKMVLFNNVFGQYAQRLFVVGICKLSELRDSEIIFENYDYTIDVEQYLKDERDLLIRILNDLKEVAQEDIQKVKTIRSNTYKIKTESWEKCLDVVTKVFKDLKGISFSKTNPPSALVNDCFIEIPERGKTYKFTEASIADIDNAINKIEELKYRLGMDVLATMLPLVTETFKSCGNLDFYDFTYYLTESLRKSSATDHKLIDHIYNKHRYFLIDECQDTNPLQTQLFFFLAGTKITDNWMEVEPKPGSLFIVGDPKQSIYRFRNADVNAFNITKKLFMDENSNIGDVLILSRNFRSSRILRTWFNEVMNEVLFLGENNPENLVHEDIEIIDSPKDEKENEATLKGVYKYSVPKDRTYKKFDALYVTYIIQKIVNNPKYTISTGKTGEIRTIQYKDIMVVPPNTGMEYQTKAFTDFGIPFIVEGHVPFNECLPLVSLKDILLLLVKPNDKHSFVRALECPLYNLDDNDLINLVNAGFDFTMNGIKPIDSKYDPILNELNSLYKATLGMSFSSMFLYLIENVKYYEKLDISNLETLYFVLELIKNGERELTITTADELIGEINVIFENKKAHEKCLGFIEKQNRVKLANVHKVKGLQAPIVILSLPCSKNGEPNKRIERDENGSKAYVFDISDTIDGITTKRISTNCDLIQEKKKLEVNSAEAELRRLEYVGATRAESVLFITEPSDSLAVNEHNLWSHLANSTKDIFDFSEEQPNEFKYVEPSSLKNDPINLEDKYSETYQIVSPSSLTRIRKNNVNNRDVSSDEIDLAREKFTNNRTNFDSSIMGTLVHELMEKLVSSRNTYSSSKVVDEIINNYGGVNEYKNRLLETYKVITSKGYNQLNGSLPSNLLEELKFARKVMCEVPFTYKENNKIVNGTIDLIYLKENSWHIVDYKTNKENDVSKLEIEYKGQLDEYKKAVKIITGEEVDAHIYHIDIE